MIVVYLTAESTVTSKGQIVLAKEVREALGIKPGQKVVEIVDGRVLKIMPMPEKPFLALKGMLKDVKMTAQQIEDEILDAGEV